MRKSKPAKNVDEYLAGTPDPARSTLKHIRAVIRSVVPKETTEVISYRIPMFKYKGMLVGYAAFSATRPLRITAACSPRAREYSTNSRRNWLATVHPRGRFSSLPTSLCRMRS